MIISSNYQNQKTNFTAKIHAPKEMWSELKRASKNESAKNEIVNALEKIKNTHSSEVLALKRQTYTERWDINPRGGFNTVPEHDIYTALNKTTGEKVAETGDKNWLGFFLLSADKFAGKAKMPKREDILSTLINEIKA